MGTFDSLTAIPTPLLETLHSLSFEHMTPIQEEAIPLILEHKDILAQSKTGSGKTLAFGLPIILQTDTTIYKPQTLIITPTRELAEQVAIELRKIGAYKPNLKILTLYGGVPLRPQADSLAKGAHILIGTPGRLEDHLTKGTLTLDHIKTVVLDEADRMLDMGFYESVLKIDTYLPKTKQTLLFSATFPPKIEKLAQEILKEHKTIKTSLKTSVDTIQEIAYETTDKFQTLVSIINTYKPSSLLVFCNTKVEVMALADKLYDEGHSVIQLHGDLDQPQRNEAMIAFSNGSRPLMIATDVASRGLDIKNIALVVNYDLPFDQEVYTHRIGRTGRAEAKGIAISLYTPKESNKYAYIADQSISKSINDLDQKRTYLIGSNYDTLCINGGKRAKLRAGDILGTLCKEIGVDPKMIGKIDITENKSYIAINHTSIKKVAQSLKKTPIKKKKYISWILD